MEAILTGLFLFSFEITQCKYHFDTNLVKIHSAVIEILSFSCFALFLVTTDGGHLGMPKLQNIKKTSYKKHSGTKLDQFQPRIFLDIVIFVFMLFLITAPGRHLG